MGSSSSKPDGQTVLDINTFYKKLINLHVNPKLYAKVPAIIKANTKLSDPEIAYFVFYLIPNQINIEDKLKEAEQSGSVDPQDAQIRLQIKLSANEQIRKELVKNLQKLNELIDQITTPASGGSNRKKLKTKTRRNK